MAYVNFLERLKIPDYDDNGQVGHGKVVIDQEKCKGCGLCVKACPADALTMQVKKARMKPTDVSECMLCGDCAAICPEQAVALDRSYRYSGYYKTLNHGDMEGPRF